MMTFWFEDESIPRYDETGGRLQRVPRYGASAGAFCSGAVWLRSPSTRNGEGNRSHSTDGQAVRLETSTSSELKSRSQMYCPEGEGRDPGRWGEGGVHQFEVGR